MNNGTGTKAIHRIANAIVAVGNVYASKVDAKFGTKTLHDFLNTFAAALDQQLTYVVAYLGG